MTKPIYTKKVITNQMIVDFQLFDKICWLGYGSILPINDYELFDEFVEIINKIRKNDFEFNNQDIKVFNYLIKIFEHTIYMYRNDEEYDEEHLGETIYNAEDCLNCCYKIKKYLKFLLELKIDYEKMKENNREFGQDLCQSVFNPERISRLASKFHLEADEYLDIL